MRQQFVASQMLRANQHNSNGIRCISTSIENKRSDVLTQNQQQQTNEKLKLEQQERARTRRTER